MKKLKNLLLLLSMASLLLSCGKTKPERLIYRYLDSDEPITLWGRDVELHYTEDLSTKVNTLYDEITKLINEEKVSSNVLHNKINSLYRLSYTYDRVYMEAYLYSSMELEDEYFDLVDKIVGEYYDAIYKMNEVEKAAVRSTKYRKEYLKSYCDLKGDELEKFIQECMTPSNPEIVENEKALSTLQNKYQAGQISTFEFFDQFIPLANDYANEKGYGNYLEHEYALSFGRSYTPNDIVSFSENAIEYLADLYNEKKTEYNQKVSTFTTKEKEKGENLNSGFFGNNLRTYEAYVDKIGGNFKKNYNRLLDDGNYFLSAKEDSPLTAYSHGSTTFDPYLFFSRNYQDLATFVHEFGHYSAGFQSSTDNMDILETQSQGNELLFSYYLSNLSDMNPNSAYMFEANEIQGFIKTIINCSWVNEFETYIFTHEGLTEQEMLDTANQLADKYGSAVKQSESLDECYAAIVIPDAPGYYISYAVSAMTSLSLYALAKDKGFDVAATSYRSISSIPYGEPYEDSMQNANLYNPLTDEGFEAIAASLNK